MRSSLRFTSIASAAVLLTGLAACGSQPLGTTAPGASYPSSSYPTSSYPAQHPQSSYVEYGRVSNVEVLRTQEQGKGTGVGAVLGGVAGAVVGHQIGGGRGRDAATVIGAVGGAVAGHAIEKGQSTTVRETYRVSVQLDNGVFRAYDVPSYGELRIGDRVRIENNLLYRIQ
ncbi:MAG: glycine zipper 2TM domain-containing protein [Polaromonas sp.]